MADSRETPPRAQAQRNGLSVPLLGRAASLRFVRFLVVGAIGYLVNQLVLFTLYDSGLPTGLPNHGDRWHFWSLTIRDPRLLISSVIAIELSIASNFLWHQLWTFSGRSGGRLAGRFVRFNLTSLGSPAISLFMVNTLTPFFGVNYLVANSLGILLGTAWNWTWASMVIWRKPVSDPAKPVRSA